MNDDDLKFEYVPFGEVRQLTLTPALVSDILAVRTKKGVGPSKADVRIFLERCAAQGLNPFVGDAFLIGYDNNDSTATFNLITTHQALLKRAEPHPQYDGLESGVTVMRREPQAVQDRKPTPEELEARANRPPIADRVIERKGEMVFADEVIVGGWCRVYRKDKSRPAFASLTFSVYNTGYSRWQKDPGGMIVKCAEASALREAFPNTLGGLYIAQEMEAMQHQALALPDGREEQAANRLIIPSASEMADDRRACVPTAQRPIIHDMSKPLSQDQGQLAPPMGDTIGAGADGKSSDTDRKPESEAEPARPTEIDDMIRKIRASKTETSLLMQKMEWRKMKDSFPEFADLIGAQFTAAESRVAPAGSKRS